MKKIYSLIIGTLLCFGINAQTYQWASRPGLSYAQKIKCDNIGNSYTSGTNSGYTLVAKYDTGGTLIWSFGLNTASSSLGGDVTIDALKNIYITGVFQGTCDFNPGAGTDQLISTASSNDIFVAKYDSLGNYVWAFAIGNSNTENGFGIEADISGDVYVTGKLSASGSVDFDPSAVTANLSGGGAFLAKYNSLGQYLWAFNIAGARGADLCLNSVGDIYMYGQSASGIDFDPGTGTALLAGSGNSIFLARYNSSGIYQSLLSIANAAPSITTGSFGIHADALDNIYCTGSVQGSTVDFDQDLSFIIIKREVIMHKIITALQVHQLKLFRISVFLMTAQGML